MASIVDMTTCLTFACQTYSRLRGLSASDLMLMPNRVELSRGLPSWCRPTSCSRPSLRTCRCSRTLRSVGCLVHRLKRQTRRMISPSPYHCKDNTSCDGSLTVDPESAIVRCSAELSSDGDARFRARPVEVTRPGAGIVDQVGEADGSDNEEEGHQLQTWKRNLGGVTDVCVKKFLSNAMYGCWSSTKRSPPSRKPLHFLVPWKPSWYAR